MQKVGYASALLGGDGRAKSSDAETYSGMTTTGGSFMRDTSAWRMIKAKRGNPTR